jgi:hypothetical protein
MARARLDIDALDFAAAVSPRTGQFEDFARALRATAFDYLRLQPIVNGANRVNAAKLDNRSKIALSPNQMGLSAKS